jgi:hypothetical protein
MSFLKKYQTYLNLVTEQDEQGVQPQDATAPDAAAAVPAVPSEPTTVAPEGYVNLVKLLAKSLAMNIPVGNIDALFATTEVTSENAFNTQDELEKFLKENEIQSDNPERLENINYKKFISSVNATNFEQKLKQLITAMEQRDPSVKQLFPTS